MQNPNEFSRRRTRLMRAMGKNSIAVVATAPLQLRNRDVEHQFRPDSDFFYLTGFPEPEAVVVLIPGRKEGQYVLFCRDRDATRETWEGRREGPAGAVKNYGADEAYPVDKLDDLLPQLMENKSRVFYAMGGSPEFDQRMMQWRARVQQKTRSGVRTPGEMVSLEHVLHEMRLRKSSAEIAQMAHAAKISAGAHRRAMQVCRPGMAEYQVEAELLHEFLRHGSRRPAYPSIVAGGRNACILHYTENSEILHDGDLLLIDAGAEYAGYASDITRTFPVGGRFSPQQKAVYEWVLKAQLAAIDQVRPGKRWNEPHDAAVRVLTQGLVKLGLLKGTPAKLIKEGAYRRFYMHRTGHWLGMDVHDVGEYMVDGKWRRLEPGMVLTVEPGLYIPPRSKGVDKQWWGIGVRIEDDVVVTSREPRVLTGGVPKTVDEIERLMNGTKAA